MLANGGVAGVLVVLWFLLHDSSLYVAYVGSVAAATADTWGTEIGVLPAGSPRLITDLSVAERGRSGAVSGLGLSAGVMGGAIISIVGAVWIDPALSAAAVFSCIAGGVAGSLVDSYLGAAWMTNDIVNLACTSAGAVVSFLSFGVFR